MQNLFSKSCNTLITLFYLLVTTSVTSAADGTDPGNILTPERSVQRLNDQLQDLDIFADWGQMGVECQRLVQDFFNDTALSASNTELQNCLRRAGLGGADNGSSSLVNQIAGLTVPGYPNARPVLSSRLWNGSFPRGLSYVADFESMTKNQLGESLWTRLEVGQRPNNDAVISDISFRNNSYGFNLDITAFLDDQEIFVYLDWQQGGLGACQKILSGEEAKLDNRLPGEQNNLCWIAEDNIVGKGESILIRTDTDVWVSEITFRGADDLGLFADAVEIDGGIHVFDTPADLSGKHAWRPSMPYFISAFDGVRIARVNADFFITGLKIFESEPRELVNFAADYVPTDNFDNNIDDVVTDETRVRPSCSGRSCALAKISEPSSLIILLMGIAGLFLIHRGIVQSRR